MKKCPTCNAEMEMYYRPWCPLCDRPEVEERKTLNLIQVCRHLVRKHDLDEDQSKGHYRCLWLILCDSNYVNNDTFAQIDFPTWYFERCETNDDEDDEDYNVERGFELMKLIIDDYDLDNEEGSRILWEISW